MKDYLRRRLELLWYDAHLECAGEGHVDLVVCSGKGDVCSYCSRPLIEKIATETLDLIVQFQKCANRKQDT